MSRYVNKNAKGNKVNNVGARQFAGSDGNGEGTWPIAEFGMKNEETRLTEDFDHKCRINNDIGHDSSDEVMTGMEESSSNAKNERPANNERERVILHWDDKLKQYVEGFRPFHEMIRWDAEKRAYVAYYEKEPPPNTTGKPPVFHWNKELGEFVEGMRMTQTMIWWDSEHGYFTPRLTQRMKDAFNRDNALNRKN